MKVNAQILQYSRKYFVIPLREMNLIGQPKPAWKEKFCDLTEHPAKLRDLDREFDPQQKALLLLSAYSVPDTAPDPMLLVQGIIRQYITSGGLAVTVSAPGGEELATRTFNPQLGIEGGISILGTSGIVEPMSERAIIETTALEIRQAAEAGGKRLILLPGNYGLDFLQGEMPELALVPRVKCSNYIGDALDLALLEGMEEVLLIGHVGKLVKLAGGIMNTHSRMADCRRELFCAHAALCGADRETCESLMRQVTTDGCLEVLERSGLCKPVIESLLREIQTVLERRSGGACRMGAVLFSNVYGLLGKTAEAEALLREWRGTT